MSSLNFRCTGDSGCLGHMYDNNQKSCGLIHGSNDQNQVLSAIGHKQLYVKGIINRSNFRYNRALFLPSILKTKADICCSMYGFKHYQEKYRWYTQLFFAHLITTHFLEWIQYKTFGTCKDFVILYHPPWWMVRVKYGWRSKCLNSRFCKIWSA